jgi:hypothetical protein
VTYRRLPTPSMLLRADEFHHFHVEFINCAVEPLLLRWLL